jgi:hypothetical protein
MKRKAIGKTDENGEDLFIEWSSLMETLINDVNATEC